MFHHNEQGEVENGEVRFQLKATRTPRTSRNGEWIAQSVDTRDLRYWYFEPYPLIVILYVADRQRAFWLHVQEYVDRHPELLDSEAQSMTVRVPTRNRLNLHNIDRFRKLSLAAVASFLGRRV
jgi:hypothetical protein